MVDLDDLLKLDYALIEIDLDQLREGKITYKNFVDNINQRYKNTKSIMTNEFERIKKEL
jgi:DNA topoisomerase IA